VATTDWTPDLIERRTEKLLGKQGPFRPTVRLVVTDGRPSVAKDYRACTPLYRWTVGAWNLRRERIALERLAGLDGIPLLEARVGRWILVMTHFEGRDLGKTKKRNQTPAYFDELMALVESMHARGVVHLDLRQRRNVLVRPGHHPAILDFGSALCVRPGSRFARWLGRIDRSGVLKYKRRANPEALTAEEEEVLHKVERRRKLWPFS
jgi:RIO-like serine/threonine protein kinase